MKADSSSSGLTGPLTSQMRISLKGLQPAIIQRLPNREMIQTLPLVILLAQHSMRCIMEETADAGASDACGFGFQIENLAQ